nr:hypothetical protein [Tanacetum cinerariifolium]
MWSTCNPGLSFCSGYEAIYRKDENGMLEELMCFWDHERQSVGGNRMTFADFLKIRYGKKSKDHTTRERQYYEWVAQNTEFNDNGILQEAAMYDNHSLKFRDHVMELDIVDTMVFQLRGVKRSMSMRQFVLALGLYTEEEMNNNLFEFFCDACVRNRPNNYNPTTHCVEIITRNNCDSCHPPSYTTIKNRIHHLVHRLLTCFVAGRYNGLSLGELVDDMLDNSEDEAAAAEARRAQDEVGGVRRHPNISFTNRLRAMDDNMGDIDTKNYKLSSDVK